MTTIGVQDFVTALAPTIPSDSAWLRGRDVFEDARADFEARPETALVFLRIAAIASHFDTSFPRRVSLDPIVDRPTGLYAQRGRAGWQIGVAPAARAMTDLFCVSLSAPHPPERAVLVSMGLSDTAEGRARLDALARLDDDPRRLQSVLDTLAPPVRASLLSAGSRFTGLCCDPEDVASARRVFETLRASSVDLGAPASARCDPAAIQIAEADDVAALRALETLVDLDAVGVSGTTPLGAAIAQGSARVVAFLVGREGVDVARRNGLGETYLHEAAYWADRTLDSAPTTIDLLLDEGVDPSVPDRAGRLARDLVVAALPYHEGRERAVLCAIAARLEPGRARS